MSVRRDPPVYLPPTRPTPLCPPLTLSPLDVSMLSSRLDFLFVYDKRNASAAAQQRAASQSSAFPFASSTSSASAVSVAPAAVSASPRHYHIPPPLSAEFMCMPHLQQSLRDALSEYHVLAGRLTVDSYHQQAIRLTDEGVGWITARCDLTVDGVLPPPHLRGDQWDLGALPAALLTSLPPQASSACPLLQVQYTTMACGSVCLGVSVYHGVMDAKALFLFMAGWAQQSRGKKFTRPSHDRHTLANMRAAHSTLITHDEYVIVNRRTPSQPSTPTSASSSSSSLSSSSSTSPAMPPSSALHRSRSMGPGQDMSLGPAAPSRARTETVMRNFYFSKLEIERMKRAVLEVPSPSASVLNSPLQSPSSLSLPPAMTGAPPTTAVAPASRTIYSSPLSPGSSMPTSPRMSSLSYNAPYHPDYISTFDVLSAHFWQLVLRARYPQLVAALPPPPPPPSHLLSTATSGLTSPTGSRPTTPTRAPGPYASRPAVHTPPSAFFPTSPTSVSVAYAGNAWAPPPLPSSVSVAAAHQVITHLAIAFNGRNRLDPPLPDVYCGNATFLSVVGSPLPALLTSPLPTITRLIRARMNLMVGEYLRSALTVLATPLPPSTTIVPSFDCRSSDVLTTSFLHSDVYGVDFGGGGPEWVGVMAGGDRSRWEGFVALMAGGRGGGVDVVVCLKEEEMRRLVQDERLRCWRDVDTGRGLGGLTEQLEHLAVHAGREMEAT